MSDRIATLMSNSGVITLILDGNNYLIGPTHPNYEKISEALKVEDADLLVKLVDIPKAVTSYSAGEVEVKGGEVYYEGKILHNTITDRIIELMEKGFPFNFMLNFLKNLMENPSHRAVNELYDFMEHKGLPITSDGHLLAYKGIRKDWMDKHSGTVDNHPGEKPSMPRNEVDDNREEACGKGYHGGSLEYVRDYCTERVIIIKVNPRDVVSVPQDCNAQKVRFCDYEVLREYTGEINKHLEEPAYEADGSIYCPECAPPPEDDDYPDYDDDSDPCDDCEEDCLECDLLTP